MKLEDLRVIVTGAAQGIGRHVAGSLCNAGAVVAAVDINLKGLETLRSELSTAPGKLFIHKADVGKEPEAMQVVQSIVAEAGFVNGLINNAAVCRDGLLVRPTSSGAIKMPLRQWDAVNRTDLTGSFLMAREVVAHMVDDDVKPGVIINMSSVARHGNAGQGNYAAAKAGVVAATKSWAMELATHGIRVGCIAPGFVRTPILDAVAPEMLEKHLSRVPLGRLGEPEEIMQGMQFIIECEFFTGRCLEIDGGFDF